MAADLTAADPAAIAVGWLSRHPAVLEVLGGEGLVGARNEPPYPRVRVLDVPGGDDRYMRWLIHSVLQIEVFGDPDGRPGKAALRRVMYVCLQAMEALPRETFGPGEAVVTALLSRGGAGWSPEPTGQPRYVGTVLMSLHPPAVDAPVL